MSQENVELVIRTTELSRKDTESFFSVCDPEIEWDMSRLMPAECLSSELRSDLDPAGRQGHPVSGLP
jgi:hypothetical protein